MCGKVTALNPAPTQDKCILNYFKCQFLGAWLQNSVITSAGEKGMQGVALRVSSPKAMFYRVRIKGSQDTLLDNIGNHYFFKCHIIGKVDFICGRAKSLYEVI